MVPRRLRSIWCRPSPQRRHPASKLGGLPAEEVVFRGTREHTPFRPPTAIPCVASGGSLGLKGLSTARAARPKTWRKTQLAASRCECMTCAMYRPGGLPATNRVGCNQQLVSSPTRAIVPSSVNWVAVGKVSFHFAFAASWVRACCQHSRAPRFSRTSPYVCWPAKPRSEP